MKKICFTFALLVAVLVLVPVAANASTDTETQICEYVKNKDKVSKAQCVIYEHNCIVAIKTEKFTSKSDYDTFKKQLEKEIAEKFELDKVLITRNPAAMHAITQIVKLSDEERDEALERFFEEEFHQKRPEKQPRSIF